jgi:hypothetical protein
LESSTSTGNSGFILNVYAEEKRHWRFCRLASYLFESLSLGMYSVPRYVSVFYIHTSNPMSYKLLLSAFYSEEGEVGNI